MLRRRRARDRRVAPLPESRSRHLCRECSHHYDHHPTTPDSAPKYSAAIVVDQRRLTITGTTSTFDHQDVDRDPQRRRLPAPTSTATAPDTSTASTVPTTPVHLGRDCV